MRGGVDFLLQDLLGTGNGQFGNTLAQLLLGTFDFLVNLGLGTGDNLVRPQPWPDPWTLLTICWARFSAAAITSEAFSSASRRASAEPLGSDLLLLLAAFGGREAISNLLLAVGHRLCSGGQTYFIVIQMKIANQIA